MRSLLVVVCAGYCFMSGCCGDYQLIVVRDRTALPDSLNWQKELSLCLPRNELEKSIVAVAANHREQESGKTMIVYISHDERETLVATVENISPSDNKFEPKKLVRYLVQSGRIRATMGPNVEPFPDATFERSVLFTSQKALEEGGWAVNPILDWVEPVAIRGTVLGKCNVEVKIFRTDNGGPGDLICTKSVNPCLPE